MAVKEQKSETNSDPKMSKAFEEAARTLSGLDLEQIDLTSDELRRKLAEFDLSEEERDELLRLFSKKEDNNE